MWGSGDTGLMLRNNSLQLFSRVATEVKAAKELTQFSTPPTPLSDNCRCRLFLEATAEGLLGTFEKLYVILWLESTSAVACLLNYDHIGYDLSQKSTISKILSKRKVKEREKLTFCQDRTCIEISAFASTGWHKFVIKCIFKAKTKKA